MLGLCMNPIARVLGEMAELTAAMHAEHEGNLAGFRAILAGLDAITPGCRRWRSGCVVATR